MATRKFGLRLRFLFISIAVLFSLALVSSVLAALPIDTTIADFNTGTVGSCYVGPSTWDGGVDGEVSLLPALDTGFPGTDVPAGWYKGTYPGGSPLVVAGSFITTELSYAGVTNAVNRPNTLEFEAVFTGQSQWIGFASDMDLSNIPWALFSTSGSDLYASTSFAALDKVLTGTLGVPHRFRIDWNPNVITYYIDDVLVATHNVDIAVAMRPIIADNASGNVLSVDWLRMGPYSPTSCTYTSTLVNSGILTPTWTNLVVSSYIPANTTLTFETRSGAVTDTTDPSWTSWQTVTGSSIAGATGNGRYLQYRAQLSTSDSLATPRIYSVQAQGTTPTAIQLSSLSGQSASTLFNPLVSIALVLAAGLMVVVVGYQLGRVRRSQR